MSKSQESKPIVIKDEQGNPEYTLTFTRETVKHAENRGFKISEITDFPETNVKALFFFAFRVNHKGMNSIETDKIYDELAVDRKAMIGRLVDLYNAPMESLMADTSDDAKNFKRAVEL